MAARCVKCRGDTFVTHSCCPLSGQPRMDGDRGQKLASNRHQLVKAPSCPPQLRHPISAFPELCPLLQPPHPHSRCRCSGARRRRRRRGARVLPAAAAPCCRRGCTPRAGQQPRRHGSHPSRRRRRGGVRDREGQATELRRVAAACGGGGKLAQVAACIAGPAGGGVWRRYRRHARQTRLPRHAAPSAAQLDTASLC